MRITLRGFGTAAVIGIATISATALLAVSCTGSAPSVRVDEGGAAVATVPSPSALAGTTASPTPAAKPTTEAEPELALLDQQFLDGLADRFSFEDGTVLIATVDAAGRAIAASSGSDTVGNSPTVTDPFRVGSVTKVFTAVATLALVDDGLVDLDAPASDYVSRIVVPPEIRVRDLLQHTAGTFNLTDSADWITAALAAPDRLWMPEELFEFVADEPLLYEPGTTYSYSNTNYLILGVLIEEVVGRPYHEVIRERIIEPLAMSSTYLEALEEGPEPFGHFEIQGQFDYDYTAIASSAWSAGALVSSAPDLHVFFTALFNGEIVPEQLIVEMAQGVDAAPSTVPFGLGLWLDHSTAGFYGHPGGSLGYLVRAYHAPEPGVTVFLALADPQVFAPTDGGATITQIRDRAMQEALSQLTGA